MNKIGVMGGTFDPVHNGHLAIAREARNRVGLDKVLLVPAKQQPLKEHNDIASAEHRLNMIKLAITDYQLFEVSTVELERAEPSFTVDTLGILKKQYNTAELYFIMGWDSLVEMPLWKNPGKIIKLCEIVAMTRTSVSPPVISELDDMIPGIIRRLIVIDIEPIDISSTDIRRRIREGLSIRGMVPSKVEEYIINNGLYQ